MDKLSMASISLGSACAPVWVDAFAEISLAQLNQRAAMMERLDNKYLLAPAQMHAAIGHFLEHFEILAIDGLRSFRYDSCYFDDAELGNYHDHQRGKRQRFKVRVRRYLDSDLCFLEVKLKDRRGITLKKRWPHQASQFEQLDATELRQIEAVYQHQYGHAYGLPICQQLRNSYQRVTLVSKTGAERMTIDHTLRFNANGKTIDFPDVFLLETKSHNANGLADRILREQHQHPISGCSKYCVGLSVTGAVQRYNRFLPALRRLGATDLPGLDRMPATPANGTPVNGTPVNGTPVNGTPVNATPVQKPERNAVTNSLPCTSAPRQSHTSSTHCTP
jgi:hypothetical protein